MCCEVVLTVERSCGGVKPLVLTDRVLQGPTCRFGIASYLQVLCVVESRSVSKHFCVGLQLIEYLDRYKCDDVRCTVLESS